MGRTTSGGEQSPACGQQGTPPVRRRKAKVRRRSKRTATQAHISTDADANALQLAKRQILAQQQPHHLRTMPPVKPANGSGEGVADKAGGVGLEAAGVAAVVDVAPKQFRFADVVAKKQQGAEWSEAEIEWFVSEMVSGNVQQCQIGAWLMVAFLQGMNHVETAALTRSMMESGDTLSWPEEWQGRLVDKHSTGGVGDKVSLILAPALAACGMKVPMISGRGLGHTGGTLDKLESIPGYTVLLEQDRMMDILTNVGCCICGQTSNLVPADKMLYAIRDVTSTVASLPLITASIISKKAAERVNALVLDVKVGKAALFSSDEKLGRRLATSLVSASSMLGTKASALMTRMDNPIGRCIGNSLEVAESLQVLHGKGPTDLRELVIELGGCLLDSLLNKTTGKQQIEKAIADGSALGKFREMIVAQGVSEPLAKRLCALPMDDTDEIWEVLAKAGSKIDLRAEKEGYISGIDSLKLAKVCLSLGAGRAVAGADIDFSVGAKLLAHVGSKVNKGEPWVTIYHQPSHLTKELISQLQSAVEYSDETVTAESIVIDIIRSS